MRRKRKKGSDIIFQTCLILFMVGVIACIFIVNSAQNKLMKEFASFSEEDYKFMHEEIESNYGNGGKFHVVSENEEVIRVSDGTTSHSNGQVTFNSKTLGRKVEIWGYFDSEDTMYKVVYAKYIEDNPGLKDGKAGTLIFKNVFTNYTKDDYFEEFE